MGRNEAPLDPQVGPLAQFAAELRQLRTRAGSPSYRAMARRAHFAASTLSTAAGGRIAPSWAVVQAYVRACGGDLEEWNDRWRTLQESLQDDAEPVTGSAPSPLPGPAPAVAYSSDDDPSRPGRRGFRWGRPRGLPAATASVVVLAAVVIITEWSITHHTTSARTGGTTVTRVPGPSAGAGSAASSPTVSPIATTPGGTLTVLIAGPGCPAQPGTQVAEATRGDGWTSVPGGLSRCAHQARTTRANGDVRLVEDSYTWTFRLPGRQTCTAAVWIADSPPSSAMARYDVAAGSGNQPRASLEVLQARHKGEWVTLGTWTLTGQLRIRLTDSPSYSGATYHVTAAAARAVCAVGNRAPSEDG